MGTIKSRLSGINPLPVTGITLLTIIYFAFLFQITEIIGFNILRIIFRTGMFFIFTVLILNIIKSKYLRIGSSIIIFIVIMANLLHFRYYGTTFPLGSLFNFQFLPILGPQIISLVKWHDWLVLSDAGIATYLIGSSRLINGKNRWFIEKTLVVVYLGLLVFQFFAETQTMSRQTAYYGENDSRRDIYCNLRCQAADHSGSILQFGFVWTYFADLLELVTSYRPIIMPPPETSLTIDSTRTLRNIIIIQVESLDRNIINREFNGQPVTPFLNHLAKTGQYFNNIFAQHSPSGGTSDGDFCTLTAVYPLGYRYSLGSDGLQNLPALPRILRKFNYTSLAFHANSGKLYARQKGYRLLGFDQTYFRENLPPSDPDRWHAMKDRELFTAIGTKLVAAEEPFMVFVVTLSSHGPYDLLDQSDFHTDFKTSDPILTNYLNSIAYTDAALEEFCHIIFQDYPHTLFFIYGDHSSNIETKEYTATNDHLIQPIAVILYDPLHNTANTNSTTGSSIDFAPTIFDYLGYPAPGFWQGQSLFRDKADRNPIFISGSSYYFDRDGNLKNMRQVKIDDSPLYKIQDYIR